MRTPTDIRACCTSDYRKGGRQLHFVSTSPTPYALSTTHLRIGSAQRRWPRERSPRKGDTHQPVSLASATQHPTRRFVRRQTARTAQRKFKALGPLRLGSVTRLTRKVKMPVKTSRVLHTHRQLATWLLQHPEYARSPRLRVPSAHDDQGMTKGPRSARVCLALRKLRASRRMSPRLAA